MLASQPAVVTAPRGIDHVTITTSDCAAARRFYERVLRPLGFSVVFDWPEGRRAYLGLPAEPSSIWLVHADDPGRVELTLVAPDRAAVDAFFAAAVAGGGRELSPPGFRPEYTARTYAAAALDLDGNAIEAVCRRADPVRAVAA